MYTFAVSNVVIHKADLLHIQAAFAIYWHAEEDVKLRNAIEAGIPANTFTGRNFKIQAKLFQAGQTWVGMIVTA